MFAAVALGGSTIERLVAHQIVLWRPSRCWTRRRWCPLPRDPLLTLRSTFLALVPSNGAGATPLPERAEGSTVVHVT